jgi:hypothetical protein
MSLVVSDSFLANATNPSPKTDNTWLNVPGVEMSIARGRRFEFHSWMEPVKAARVLLLSAGNDFRTKKGTVRADLTDVCKEGVANAIASWKSIGAEVFFVFMGSWDWHGAEFRDADRDLAATKYGICLQSLLVTAEDSGAIVMPMPDLEALRRVPLEDGWHFSSDAQAALSTWLTNYIMHELRWPLFSSTPSPSEAGFMEASLLETTSFVSDSTQKLDEEVIKARIKVFMHDKKARLALPQRPNHAQCTCGYKCGVEWAACCEPCWVFSSLYFKALVDKEHEENQSTIVQKKISFTTLRRIVCERNESIWRFANGQK